MFINFALPLQVFLFLFFPNFNIKYLAKFPRKLSKLGQIYTLKNKFVQTFPNYQ